MKSAVIEVSDLKKSFRSTQVLKGVSLKIEEGSVVGLVGTNGAGKSTLIQCLLGLLRATGGESTIFSDDSWNLSASTKARLGYVPQTIHHYPWMYVRQIIQYTAAFHENWDKQWEEELVDRWQIPLKKRAAALSPGEAQKLALVLALGHRPELLILDEPVASLDPLGRREFLRSLLELSNNEKQTVLFSTHITADLERVATHVAILKDGLILRYSPLDELLDGFKRLRIRSTERLPDSFSVRHSIRTIVDGSQALTTVPDVDDALLLELRTKWNADVQVEDLNLEEIFVEAHDA